MQGVGEASDCSLVSSDDDDEDADGVCCALSRSVAPISGLALNRIRWQSRAEIGVTRSQRRLKK